MNHHTYSLMYAIKPVFARSDSVFIVKIEKNLLKI